MNVKIEKTTGCKMGNNQVTLWDVVVDGDSVATVNRKYHAEAIAAAIVAGHIHPSGHVEMAFDPWAYSNDRATYARLNG